MSSVPTEKWSVGLCSCGVDPSTCCLTCCLPCITFGRVAHTIDEGQSSCFGTGLVYGLLCTIQFQWLYSCIYRGKMRAKYGLPAEPCHDCCVHFCCEPFALCQEHAELQSRGLDPSKGWNSLQTAPPVPPHMEK